jgi:hypothetical protein
MATSKRNDESLLAEAVRDWRSGRAYLAKGGHYKLREGDRRNIPAPWNKTVKRMLGTPSDPSGSSALSDLGRATYGERQAPSNFEQMHGLDRVRSELLSDIAAGRPPLLPPGTKRG